MRIHPLHRWDLSPTEAVALQREFADRIITDAPLPPCSLIAGADVSYNEFDPTVFAGVVVLHLPELSVVEQCGAEVECHFPYIPGLLSFREGPAVLEAFAKLKTVPDAVMLDGQGYAHPPGSASPACSACGSTFPPSAAPKRPSAWSIMNRDVKPARGCR